MKIRHALAMGIFLFAGLYSFGQSASGFTEEGGNVYYNGNFVTNIAYQENADRIRLKHLEYYGRLIEEYFEKTGRYPLQTDADIPVYVYIANRDQFRFTETYEKAIPFEHTVIPFKDLVAELEQGLGHQIGEYYDPQEYPDAKWNWYLYSVRPDAYYLAVHVHQRFPFSKFISPYSYKIEISNLSGRGSNLIIRTRELLESEVFQNERSKPVVNEGYFTERENRYFHDTKQENP